MRADANLGFGSAYNRLITAAREDNAEYFFVINPDTILDSGSLEKLVLALRADSTLASVAPKLRRWDFLHGRKTDCIDSVGLALGPGLRFRDIGQGETDRAQYDQADIIGPSGAAGLFRMSALETIRENGAYYDEHFFMYKEDCDLAYRLHMAGFKSRLVADAIIYHDRTATGGGLLARFFNRHGRGRQVNNWAFVNQHLLWIKYWRKQNFFNKTAIVMQRLLRFVEAVVIEQYLLANYKSVRQIAKTLQRY
jgi:GT2 family glycosyltransferase